MVEQEWDKQDLYSAVTLLNTKKKKKKETICRNSKLQTEQPVYIGDSRQRTEQI